MELLRQVLDRIDEVDPQAVLMVGDLACAGNGRTRRASSIQQYREDLAMVLAAVRQRGRPFAFVPGNHDLRDLPEPENVDGRGTTLAGLRVSGIGGAGPDIFGFAYEWQEDEIRRLRLPAADVLLCHAPPRETSLDRTHHGWHVGSTAIRERASAMRGVLLCGHIHESAGAAMLNDCLCMNVGALGRPFGRPCLGFVQDLDHLWHEDLGTGRVQEWRRGG